MDSAITTHSSRDRVVAEFQRVRQFSEILCQPLQQDDFQIQSIVQTSPPKWHIAHVSWFFEAFVLPHFNP
ncbi:MAG: ergothioneine biosynthesis protein EgtB, partial [Candidatus Thiodiazotropha sp.]